MLFFSLSRAGVMVMSELTPHSGVKDKSDAQVGGTVGGKTHGVQTVLVQEVNNVQQEKDGMKLYQTRGLLPPSITQVLLQLQFNLRVFSVLLLSAFIAAPQQRFSTAFSFNSGDF
ncbi:hypothetical protein E3N88_15329 [Mikania micrantha]|uniref:Uncharacterized protein n=1 Tax=Mikania micrantha TaxID=192012 RepID=A0A5N6NVB2_9ASTR|nr:hypothetical protein E3N88_15329 [Mikania micrantha]